MVSPSRLTITLPPIKIHHTDVLCRDGNFCPTRGYPARPNPNWSDFTRSDKEQGWVWVLKKPPEPGPGRARPDPVIYINTKIPSYIYIYILLQTLTFFFFISFQLTSNPPLICNTLTHTISLSHSQITISLTHSLTNLNLTHSQSHLRPNTQPLTVSPTLAAVLSFVSVTVHRRSRFVLFGFITTWDLWDRQGIWVLFFFLRIKFGFVISVLGFVFVFVILKVKIKNLKSLCLFLGFQLLLCSD